MFIRHSALCALLVCAALTCVSVGANAGPVNINSANAATLSQELKGIGMKRAQAIVDYRQKHGPFKSADELTLVKGIGPAVIARNRDSIRTDVRPVAKSAVETAPSRSRHN
jgi:competence protein ComEA